MTSWKRRPRKRLAKKKLAGGVGINLLVEQLYTLYDREEYDNIELANDVGVTAATEGYEELGQLLMHARTADKVEDVLKFRWPLINDAFSAAVDLGWNTNGDRFEQTVSLPYNDSYYGDADNFLLVWFDAGVGGRIYDAVLQLSLSFHPALRVELDGVLRGYASVDEHYAKTIAVERYPRGLQRVCLGFLAMSKLVNPFAHAAQQVIATLGDA